MKRIKIVTSGTGIERASKSLMDEKISDVISISYTEMLLSKSGNSKYFDDEYFMDLNPVKNRRVIDYLKSTDKSQSMKSLEYAPDINFYKFLSGKMLSVMFRTRKI
jgi:hypothetical protein